MSVTAAPMKDGSLALPLLRADHSDQDTARAHVSDQPRQRGIGRQGGPLAGFAILALATLVNAGLGAYHSGVEWGFWQGPTDCSGPVVNLGSANDLLSRLDTVKVVRCDEVQWRFLGLSLAGYNVLISLLMAAIATWGFVRTAKRT